MPIDPSAVPDIRRQLERIASGERPTIIVVGVLTPVQHQAISKVRVSLGLPELESPELVYLGRHHFASRSADGYMIEDMIAQVVSGTSIAAHPILTPKMTVLENPDLRADGYGFAVRDRAVLELTARKPRAEILSVVPKGDGGGPKNRKAP
jgi:hypothetical protein